MASSYHWLPSTLPVHAVSTPTTIFVTTPNGSNNITDLSNTQRQVTFSINVSLSPSINAFQVFLNYNTTIFSAPSLDYSGSIFGSSSQVLLYCIDNHPQQGATCQPQDGTGVISLALYMLGNQSTPATTSGLLFHVTLNVIGTGLGQIHILPADSKLTAAGSTRAYVPFKPQDGYYTNLACPKNSSVACKSPMVTIRVSPASPSLGSTATFNATVIDSNANAVVRSYVWDWGDGTPVTLASNSSSRAHAFVLNTFGLGSPCITSGACPVTVTVLDSDGVSWKTTLVVQIVHLFIKLSVSELTIDHQFNSVPGTQIHISVKIQNHSTIGERANLTIYLDNRALISHPFSLNASGSQFGTGGQLSVYWNTSGYAPRAYAVSASLCRQHCSTIDPQSGLSGIVSAQTVQGSLLYGENVTSESTQTSYVILIIPQVLGALSLGLLQTAGLGILVVVAVALGLARFLKKPSYESEPL